MEICRHLRKILDFELQKGNAIKHKGQLWTKMEYSVYLEKPMDKNVIENTLKLDSCVKYSVSKDPHFLMHGFYCTECIHNIDSPPQE